MKVEQIYSLLNDINAQMFGENAVDVHDLRGIISMGETIIGNENNTDLFLGKLVDRIGKTVVRTLDLELDFPALFMNEFEFGCILQKITVNPYEAIRSSEFDIGSDNFTPTLLDVHKPSIVVNYFKGSDTWAFRTTIPDDLFTSAFTSETMMGQFIDAIVNALSDSMTLAINNMSRTAINNLIAEKIKGNNGVINLLTGFNATQQTPLTVAQAIRDKEFYRYASNEIRKYIKYLGEASVLYNMGDNILRRTARDNMHVLMLTDFVSGFESYLSSDLFHNDLFHNDLLGMPLFNEVAYWQGNKGASTSNDFATNSTIKVIPSSEAGKDSPTEVTQSGVVCVLADRQSVAVGLNKRKSGSFYNSIDYYTNLKSSAQIQYINDTSENCVCFVVAESE